MLFRAVPIFCLCLLTLTTHAQSPAQTPATAATASEAAPPKPVAISRVGPVYPPDAKAHHVEGAVVVHAVIGSDGHVKDMDIISGPEELRAATLDAVRQWVYEPYLVAGKASDVETTIAVNFKMTPVAPPPGTDAAPASTSPAPLPRGPARVSSGVMAGQILTKVAPEYPYIAKSRNVQGTVVLHAVIGTDGHIRNLGVVSGPEELRNAAMDAVRQWTYKPYVLQGKPMEVETSIQINFSLNRGGSSVPGYGPGFPSYSPNRP